MQDSYVFVLHPALEKDTQKLKKEDKRLLAKVWELIIDISKHPFEGIGKPEPLKGNLTGYWSRRINEKHRLVYKVDEQTVFIISCYGHYDDLPEL